MKLLKNIKTYFSRFATRVNLASKGFKHGFFRGYDAAKSTRLEASWITQPTSIVDDLKTGLKTLRARSRDSAQNNDYTKRWLSLLQENVVGHSGIKLRSKATKQNGKLDLEAAKKIEEAWKKWGRVGNCDVTGDMSWIDAQKLWIAATARDGEILVRKVTGFPGNPFQFALQFLDVDRLDENHFEVMPNGNRITMGVERDQWDRPVAYHLKVSASSDSSRLSPVGNIQRVPAGDIIHASIKERADQPRYAPWNTAALIRLQFLSGYEEAEIVAARTASCKMGVLEQDPEASGVYAGDRVDSDGTPVIEAEPGTFPSLPPGYSLKEWNPQHPTTAFKDFVKAVLRGIASGLSVSYNALTSDLEGVSFSSLRSGELKERDTYRSIQNLMIEHFCTPIFEAWLENAILTDEIDLRPSMIEKFLNHEWQPRGWPWVDPLKDISANAKAIANGLGSRTKFLSERGLDYRDVIQELADEAAIAKDLGVSLEGQKAQSNNLEDMLNQSDNSDEALQSINDQIDDILMQATGSKIA